MSDDHSWSWSREQRIPSDTAAGRVLLEELLDELRRQDWEEKDVFGVHLAVEEALVNAIKHGNQEDPAKQVMVQTHVSATAVKIEVTDEGGGFDPEAVPDPTDDENLEAPSGRGLMLMKSFMSSVEFNDAGNHVAMTKVKGEED